MRRGARLAAALALAALAAVLFSACESTQEKSARLERAAKGKKAAVDASGLKIATPSRTIKAVSATAVHSSEGTAVAVELLNRSAAAVAVPILISVSEGGTAGYTNSSPGLARSLTELSYIPAHGHASWVDDQATGEGGHVTATIGAAEPAKGAAPAIAILSHQLEAEPGGGEAVTGTVANRSKLDQRELVVYAVARKGGRTVAAGRSVLASLAAGATGHFQIFLLGSSAKGAALELSAPPSTFE